MDYDSSRLTMQTFLRRLKPMEVCYLLRVPVKGQSFMNGQYIAHTRVGHYYPSSLS
jgi:hypothetical protein